MENQQIFRGSVQNILWFTLGAGLLISTIDALLAEFIYIMPNLFLWYLHRLFLWPNCLIPGVLTAFILALFRRTKICLDKNQILITGNGRRNKYYVSEFVEPSIKRNTHIIGMIKYISVKCYLIFYKGNEVKKIRLYGFGEKDLEKLLAFLREKQMKYMETEKRFALVETYEKNASEVLFSERKKEHSSTVCTDLADDKAMKGEYLLPPKQLIAKEKNTVRKIGLIFLGLTLFLALFIIREIIAEEIVTPLPVILFCAAFLMLLMPPVLFLSMKQKERICARRILIGGEFIQIGEDTYTYTGIESIRLTSPRKESDSIFPVQRYLTVRTCGKKHKYWLGSQSSFGDYEKLCQELEQAMVFYPKKLEYGK